MRHRITQSFFLRTLDKGIRVRYVVPVSKGRTERKVGNRMKIYDLFSGTGSATAPLREAGHDVFAIELDKQFPAELHADILTVSSSDLPWEHPDFIWASPPCTSFSVGSFRHHWEATTRCRCGERLIRVGGEEWEHVVEGQTGASHRGIPEDASYLTYHPKSPTGRLGFDLLLKTIALITFLRPRYYIIENPTALMRKMQILRHLECRPTSYCQWGEWYMKPTDLFGAFPPSLSIPAPCKTRNGAIVWHSFQGRPATDFVTDTRTGLPCHEWAPRGSRNGTQGLNPIDAGRIPCKLATAVKLALDFDLGDT